MHRAAMTAVRLENWLKDGRGQGFGSDYKPFLQITRQDHPSIGLSHILPNQFIGRQHHLLSTLERKVGVCNLAQNCVSDMREQFPLWPCEHQSPLAELFEHNKQNVPESKSATSPGTLAIARQIGVRHANYVGLKNPYIYTTDQLVTITPPGKPSFLVAIAIKYRCDIRKSNQRRKTFRKLRLEREYWRSLGVPWLLLTERSVNEQVCTNLEWALSGAIQKLRPGDLELLTRFSLAFTGVQWTGLCIDLMEAMSRVLQINVDSCIRMLKLAFWRNIIPVDRTSPIGLQEPIVRVRHSIRSMDAWSPLHSAWEANHE